MAPVTKPLAASKEKKPRGSVLFYDGDKNRFKDKSSTKSGRGGPSSTQSSVPPDGSKTNKNFGLHRVIENSQRSTSSALGGHSLHTPGFFSNLTISGNGISHGVRSEPIPSSILPTKSGTMTLNPQTSDNAQVILRLANDVLQAFSGVPYVQVLVGVAITIIEIYNDIRTYKEQCVELVSRVIHFSQIVFEALLEFDREKGALDGSGLKGDLLQIQTVFESIYITLNDLKTITKGSRLLSVFNRTQIASRISEQERRLDNTIEMFQFKSMIKLRKYAKTSLAVQPKAGKESKDSDPLHKSFTYNPHPPEIFYGRESETEAIVTYLLQSYKTKVPPRLCILGPGGIGKTSLALTIFHHNIVTTKFQKDRHFISCEATPSAELLLAELAMIFAISMEGNILKTLLIHLQKHPCLLVLDNFETVWDPPNGRSQVESLLTEIASINSICLIMTMRGSQRPLGTHWHDVLPPLKPIDVESAMTIFKEISQKSDVYARNLVNAVDCMPLAITLLATLASVDGESTEVLWIRWQKESISMVQQGGGRSNNLEKSIGLSISSPRMQGDAGALVFLSILSMLPDGMSPETTKFFNAYIPDNIMVYKAISTLRQNALIYEDTANNIRVLNPIYLFVRNRHPPPKNIQAFVFGYFVSLALQGSLYTDHNIRSRLNKEWGNINTILLEALESSNAENLTELVQATINFSHYAYVSGKSSIQAVSRAIDKLETSSLPNLYNLIGQNGVTNQTVRRGLGGRFYIPISYLSLEANSPAIKLRADCLGCLGQLLTQQSKFSLAEQKFRMAKELHTFVGDIGGYAYDTLNLGLLMSQSEKSSEDALELFKEAVALHEKVKDLSGKAYDLLAAGGTLRELYRFDESEIMFSNAATLFLDLQDNLGLATARNGLGTVMLARSRLHEAETYLVDAARLSADAGDTVGQADSVSGLATICLLLSRLHAAQAYINHAISLRNPSEDPDYLHLLGRIYIGREAWEQATTILSRALVIHEDIDDFRAEAEDLCYLASIQYSLGNYKTSQELACRALAKNPGRATTAQIRALYALILIHSSLTHGAERELAWLLTIYRRIHDVTGQAHTFSLFAKYCISIGDFEKAMTNVKRALELHIQVGHREGQANALNLLAWTLSMQKLDQQAADTLKNAMEIFIDLGHNSSGQGDCHFFRAIILVSQSRYDDAYSAIKDAFDLHKSSSSKYGRARDLALLSNILWSRHHDRTAITNNGSPPDDTGKDDGSGSDLATSLSTMEESIELFKELGCLRQMNRCFEQMCQMQMSNSENWKPSVVPVF